MIRRPCAGSRHWRPSRRNGSRQDTAGTKAGDRMNQGPVGGKKLRVGKVGEGSGEDAGGDSFGDSGGDSGGLGGAGWEDGGGLGGAGSGASELSEREVHPRSAG